MSVGDGVGVGEWVAVGNGVSGGGSEVSVGASVVAVALGSIAIVAATVGCWSEAGGREPLQEVDKSTKLITVKMVIVLI